MSGGGEQPVADLRTLLQPAVELVGVVLQAVAAAAPATLKHSQ